MKIYKHGELKPFEIQEKHRRPIKNTALRFQLKVLLEKGHVVRRKIGKAYYYKALTRRRGALKRMAQHMSDVFCRGSAVGLIAELIKAEKLTQKEIQELSQLTKVRASGEELKWKGGKKS